MQKWNTARRLCNSERPLSRQGTAASLYSTEKPRITGEAGDFSLSTIFNNFSKKQVIFNENKNFSNYFSKGKDRLALYLL